MVLHYVLILNLYVTGFYPVQHKPINISSTSMQEFKSLETCNAAGEYWKKQSTPQLDNFIKNNRQVDLYSYDKNFVCAPQ